MKNLNCLKDHILCQIFKIILNTSQKKKNMEKRLIYMYINIQIYEYKIGNKITFKIKTGHCLKR